jgi:hypothetical protein
MMTQREEASTQIYPLSECPPEIQSVVREDFKNDPTRLKVGERLMAYVEASNTTETWEVVAPGTTLDQVMVRLLNVVPELGGM